MMQDDPAVLRSLADTLAAVGRFGQAVEAYESLLEMLPLDLDVRVALGRAQRQLESQSKRAASTSS